MATGQYRRIQGYRDTGIQSYMDRDQSERLNKRGTIYILYIFTYDEYITRV